MEVVDSRLVDNGGMGIVLQEDSSAKVRRCYFERNASGIGEKDGSSRIESRGNTADFLTKRTLPGFRVAESEL